MKFIAMVPLNHDKGRYPVGAELPLARFGEAEIARLTRTIAYGTTPMVVAVPDDAVVQIVSGSVRLQDLTSQRGTTTAHGPRVVVVENQMAAPDTVKTAPPATATAATPPESATPLEEARPKKGKG
jgi:hypothetical protein